ncbi:CRIB domain-containing protein RIC4-like, partial [Morus notabilis]
MRSDRVERFVVLPFAIGCASESSIALGKSSTTNQVKKPCHDEEQKPTRRPETEESSLSQVKNKRNGFISFLTLPKPYISGGIQRLIRSIKSLSQIF